jgi:hypothetical protein
MSRSPPSRETLIQTEEILGWRAGYIERCQSGSEGGTRHTYWVNGPYPTQCRVGGRLGSFWTACREEFQERADDNTLWAVAQKRLSGRCFWGPPRAHRAGTGHESLHRYRGRMSVTCSPIWRSLVEVSSSITCPACVCTFTRLVSVSTATTVARTVPLTWPEGPLAPGRSFLDSSGCRSATVRGRAPRRSCHPCL